MKRIRLNLLADRFQWSLSEYRQQEQKAQEEYQKFNLQQRIESDFDREIKALEARGKQ